MKRIFTLLFVFALGKLFSQTTIFSEDFSASTFTATSDWLVDNSVVYPFCSVVGSSANEKLIGQQANSATFEEAGNATAINNSTFVNIQVSWNMIRGTGSTPALTFQWSNDAGNNWNTVSYTAPGAGSWGAVSAVSLPAAASGTLIYVRWTYTSVGGFVDYVGLDDIRVAGIPSPSYYWDGTNPLHQVTSWGTNTNGTGPNPPDFTTANQNFYIRNNTTAALTAAWTLSGANSVLNVGDGTVGNKINFTIPSTFALTISGGAKLNVTNNSTLTIQNTTFPAVGNMVLGSNSTVDFAQTSNVTIWAATYGNLIFSGSGNRTQSNGSTVVNGEFILGASNTYVMANSPASITQLSGKITCNGNISTFASNLTIDGSSSNTIGTLNFTGTNAINNLVLNRSGQTLTLGSDLTFSGILSQVTQFTNGTVNLNGRTMTINGPVVFPASASNGVITGSSASGISLTGTGAITNNLLMDQTNTASRTINLTLNRSSSTLTMGNELVINTAVFTNGNLRLNGQSLTLSGASTFPASASNGAFIGSSTSSLTVSGSGAFTNSMFMDQSTAASKSLDMFTLNRASTTLALGNDLVVVGPASFPAGILSINGTLLTLSGDVTFPSLVANRGFLGSLTSSLTIDGSGTIGNSLLMNSAFNYLSEFTLNRAVTITLGNTMQSYGSINPTLGTLNTNGNLFLRSNSVNKGRIGTVGGSVTGNVRVETFAAGGTTDWTNLGPSGINGLTVASWEGQIPMTCFSCPNNQMSAGGYFVSMVGWDETASSTGTLNYVEMSYSDPLTVGKGYWTYLGNALGTTSDITWTVQGTVVQGPVPVNLTFSGPSNGNGFNLISNPYPSPISWNAVLASNPTYTSTLDNAIYVYNPDLGITTSWNGLVSVPASGGITDNIPMGQGFYVENTTTPFTLTFQESNKVKSSAPLLKTAQSAFTLVRLNVNGGGFYDETAILFHEDATPNYDKKLDAHKLFSSPGYLGYPGAYTQRTTISTRSNNSEDYSINCLPNAIFQDAVIPVLVKVYATGQHTITGTELQNLPNSCVELKDKLLNVTHDLKSGPYVCTISDTTTAPRFELRICADAAMSVSEQNGSAAAHNVLISNDQNGVYVQFSYDKPVKSTISVTNILGQKIAENKSVNMSNERIYVDAPEKNQLIFITVTSDNGKVTKKMIR